MNEEKEYTPVITVNNKKETKEAVIDGVEQVVEVPAQEGFNIETRDLEGNFEKKFFLKELEGIILFEKYEVRSKYGVIPMYFSNEFEFTGDQNRARVYCPETKTVLYEGPYAGAKEHFATGQQTKAGHPEKTFDVYSILYVMVQGEVFKFKSKMNGGNNWFDYKEGCSETRNDNGHRKVVTKFGLEKKKFGDNSFWACTLQNVGTHDNEGIDDVAAKLKAKVENMYKGESDSSTEDAKEEVIDEIVVDNIPF